MKRVKCEENFFQGNKDNKQSRELTRYSFYSNVADKNVISSI